MTQMNTRVLLARRPAAQLVAADFEVDTQPMESVGEGQFMVKNITCPWMQVSVNG